MAQGVAELRNKHGTATAGGTDDEVDGLFPLLGKRAKLAAHGAAATEDIFL